MNQEQKNRYAILKEKFNTEYAHKKQFENSLYLECLNKLRDYAFLNREKQEEIWNWLWSMVPIDFRGHIVLERVNQDYTNIRYSEMLGLIGAKTECYIVWSDATLSGLACNVETIVENWDEATAVSFYFWIITKDFHYIVEAACSEMVTLLKV